jgi:Na+-driven multidrug efflux pump
VISLIIHQYMRSTTRYPVQRYSLIANPVQRASGDAKTPAKIMMAVALNIVLDPILISGCLRTAARHGRSRADRDRISSRWLLRSPRCTSGAASFPAVTGIRLLLDSWRRSCIGILSMTSTAIAPVTTAFITYQVAQFGQAAVAGFGVASRIELAPLVLMALGTAVTPFVGQNFGAWRMDRVLNGAGWCQKFSVAYGW